MVAGWAPTTVALGLLRAEGHKRSPSIDEKVWTIVRRRFPKQLASLLVESEFDAIAPKVGSRLFDIIFNEALSAYGMGYRSVHWYKADQVRSDIEY